MTAAWAGVVAASVFNSGLLAKEDPSPDDRYEYGRMPMPLRDRLQEILALCRAFDVPLPAAAVQFPLRDPVVKSVVVGGSRPRQIRHNAELISLDTPAAYWQALVDRDLVH